MQKDHKPFDCLTLSNIKHSYLDSYWQLNVSHFCLFPGEIVAVIGLNGSGKSTFLRIAAGVLSPLGGEVKLGESNINRIQRRKIAQVLGYLPQNASCEFDMSVLNIVAMGRYPHLNSGGFLTDHDIEVVKESMVLTEIDCFEQRRISHLSGGERQRVFLASVLAQEPSILLLDEPTSSLDLHHQVRFFDLLKDLVSREIGVIVVTHDVNLASIYGCQLLLFDQGRIIKEGKPEEVLTPETIHRIYGERVLLSTHPVNGYPMLVPNTKGLG